MKVLMIIKGNKINSKIKLECNATFHAYFMLYCGKLKCNAYA